MDKQKDDWGLGEFLDGVFRFGQWGGPRGRWGPRGPRGRRQQMFEAGELRLVILRLLKEQPRHGYDIIKALEERLAGCYSPSPGTVYPTLQLLEDQGLVRVVEEEGRKVYHLTPAGEAMLEERRGELDDIISRIGETIRDVAGGSLGELNRAFGHLAARTFREAFRRGPGDATVRKVAEILRRTADEIDRTWKGEEATV
jgi:DNA-binding PadR family transcriptional regulator